MEGLAQQATMDEWCRWINPRYLEGASSLPFFLPLNHYVAVFTSPSPKHTHALTAASSMVVIRTTMEQQSNIELPEFLTEDVWKNVQAALNDPELVIISANETNILQQWGLTYPAHVRRFYVPTAAPPLLQQLDAFLRSPEFIKFLCQVRVYVSGISFRITYHSPFLVFLVLT